MPAKDDHDILRQLAERLGLDEGESENFVTSSMRRLGHKPQINWADREEEKEDGGDFFSKKREKRQVGNRPPSAGDQPSGGWQYRAGS